MTLNKATLKSALEGIGPKATIAAAAQAWATAVGNYAAGIVPTSTPAAVASAKAALQSALATAFGKANAAEDMETAFEAFATTVAGGMTGYSPTVIPASGGIGFAHLFETNRSSASDAATALSDAIHEWLKTGSSTLIATPNTVVTWS